MSDPATETPYAQKQKRLLTVWTGECLCGLIVYEKTDGSRWKMHPFGERHTDGECQALKARSQMRAVK